MFCDTFSRLKYSTSLLYKRCVLFERVTISDTTINLQGKININTEIKIIER